MRGKELRQALTAGQRVYGIAAEGYGQPRWPRLFARLGLDFVFLDNEHTLLNRETVAWAAQAYAANGIAPLLRIPEASPCQAAMGLDLGAHGIIAPYVETVAQARALVGAVKYRPLKGTALQHALNDDRFPNEATRQYLDGFNPDAVLVIMIESTAGLEKLAEMLSVGGVDAILVGPHDLSVSCGVPEEYDHPVFNRAVAEVIRTCQDHDVSVGIHCPDLVGALHWAQAGCNFIVLSSDTLFIANGIRRELNQIKQTFGDGAGSEPVKIGVSGHAI